MSCHMWPHGLCHTLQCKDGCPWHQGPHGGPAARHWEKRVGSIPLKEPFIPVFIIESARLVGKVPALTLSLSLLKKKETPFNFL